MAWDLAALMKKTFGERADREGPREMFSRLPERYVQFDLTLAWEVASAAGETVVSGVLKNTRYAHMEDVEVWVAALDAAGCLARSVCYVIPHQLRMDDLAAFSVRLPRLLAPGTPLRFTYKYRGSDGGDGGTSWTQSFDARVPAGGPLAP